jgi:hypothetical protein
MPDTIQNYFNSIGDRLDNFAPNLITSLLILIVGWILAYIIGRIIRSLLHKTKVDDRFANWMRGEDPEKPVPVERWIGSIVYYILLLVVLGIFFKRLNIPEISGPINAFTDQVFRYAPRILSAGILLAVAWVIARILKLIVSRAVHMLRLDEKVKSEDDEATQSPEEQRKPTVQKSPLSKVLGDTVYWLVFLFFLPAILDTLNLQGLLVPVQEMVNKILAYLPNLFAAVIILVIGWFVARIIKNIVVNLLSSMGLDTFGERIGINKVLGSLRFSDVLGQVVLVFILLPVLVASLDALQFEAVTAPVSNLLNTLLASLPNILAAVLLGVFAFIVGRILSTITSNFLSGVGFDTLVTRMGITASDNKDALTPSKVVGMVVMVGTILFVSMEALRQLGFVFAADLVARLVVAGSKIVVGLLLFGVGVYLAGIASRAIKASGVVQANLLATVAQVLILIFASSIALSRMGLANDIINLAFGLTIGSVAVATALAFGLGGRDVASGILQDVVSSVKRKQ